MEGLPEEEYADDGHACELAIMREQFAQLSKQFFQDRQQWLEEKRRLQDALKLQSAAATPCDSQRQAYAVLRQSGQPRGSCASILSSEAGSEAQTEDASQGGLTGSSFTYSSCRSAESRSSSPTAGVSISGPSELFTAVAELQRQLEESRRQQESASVRWTLEREALQRQIHALISMSSDSSGLAHPHLLPQRSGDAAQHAQQAAQQRQALEESESDRVLLGERVQELEAMVEDLQAERENLEQQLQMVVADAARERRAVQAASDSSAPPSPAAGAAAGAPTTPSSSDAAASADAKDLPSPGSSDRTADCTSAAWEADPSSAFETAAAHAHAGDHGTASSPACPHTPPQQQQAGEASPDSAPRCPGSSGPDSGGSRNGGGGGSGWALTLTESVRLPELLSEKAELERQLRRYREECVPVPRAEYVELSSLRNQLVYMESELEQMRQEVEESVRQREEAELELAQMAQDGVVVPHEEYQGLLRIEAEARTRDSSAVAVKGGPDGSETSNGDGDVRLTAEEHSELLTAVQERDALAEAVATLQAKLVEAEAAAANAAAAALTASAEAAAAVAVAAAAETAAAAAARNFGCCAGSEEAAPPNQDGQEASADVVRPEGNDGAGVGSAAHEAIEAAAAAGAGAFGEGDENDPAVLRSEVLMLREQLADAVGQAVAESSRLGSRVQELEEELDRLRGENAWLVRDSGAVRNALASGKLQASYSARAAAVAAEEARTAAVGELAGVQMQVQRLQDEITAARKANEEAWAQRDELQLQMAAVRDAAVRTTEALADCQACREAAELAAAAAAKDLAAVTEELAALKVELAEAREMEVLFRRDVFKSKRMLHGLPLEWMAGSSGSRTGSGGGTGERQHSRGTSGGSCASTAMSCGEPAIAEEAEVVEAKMVEPEVAEAEVLETEVLEAKMVEPEQAETEAVEADAGAASGVAASEAEAGAEDSGFEVEGQREAAEEAA